MINILIINNIYIIDIIDMQNKIVEVDELFKPIKEKLLVWPIRIHDPEIMDFYIKFIYENEESRIINHYNVKILNDIILNDIKNGLPYALYVLYNFYSILPCRKHGINFIMDIILQGYTKCEESQLRRDDFIVGLVSFIERKDKEEKIKCLVDLISDLKISNQNLIQENSLLKNHIQYQPNGSGYEEAEKHFKDLISPTNKNY